MGDTDNSIRRAMFLTSSVCWCAASTEIARAYKKQSCKTTTKTSSSIRTRTTINNVPGEHRLARWESLGENRASLPKGKTFCDPSSQDADVGMLSCGLAYKCIVDEVSTLGGVCASSTSRQLQANKSCVHCPYGFTLGQAYYDIIIDSDDTESGYGEKTCESTFDPAYYSMQLDASSCEAVASAVEAAGCCAPMCQLCDAGSYAPDMGMTNATVVDGISLPGYDDGLTCATLVTAGYVKGILDTESCPTSRHRGRLLCSISVLAL
jgi:hypothetical protein